MCKNCGNQTDIHYRDYSPKCGCDQTEVCGCPIKLELLCSYYTGDDLTPIGIKRGMDGNEILEKINEYIKTLAIQGGGTILLENVGDGAKVYAGLSTTLRNKIRSILQSDGILVTEEGNVIRIKADEEWFKELIENHINEEWFKIFIQNYFGEEWFNTFLKEMFNESNFKNYFSQYITNLIETNQIDICQLIEKCQTSENTPPSIDGIITYNVGNRQTNFNSFSQSDFVNVYHDSDGDELVSIRITGGDLTGFVNHDGTPMVIGDIISMNQISSLKYNAKNQDAAYLQTVTYVGKNEINQETQMAQLTFNTAKIADTIERCLKLESGRNYSDSITRDQSYNNTSTVKIRVVNSCDTGYTLPAQTLFTSTVNGGNFSATIPSTVIAANTTSEITVSYAGAFKEVVSSKSFTISINGSNATYTLTIIEPDVPPVTNNVTLNLANRTNKTLTKADLNYSDANGIATVTGVRFNESTTGTSRLFTNSGMTTVYVWGTELPIDTFTLYYKAPDIDAASSYVVTYDVKASGIWST